MDRRFFKVTLLVWAALVSVGFTTVWRYESAPGLPAQSADWPATTGLRLDPSRPSVVQFVHPSCPCTRASLTELAEFAEKSAGHFDLTVVVVGAPGLNETLQDSDNARRARSISGTHVVLDPSGAEARRFGAQTSGQTFAFDDKGQEAFRGGITSARGHVGPSRGLDALGALLDGQKPVADSAPVYGCPLFQEIPR